MSSNTSLRGRVLAACWLFNRNYAARTLQRRSVGRSVGGRCRREAIKHGSGRRVNMVSATLIESGDKLRCSLGLDTDRRAERSAGPGRGDNEKYCLLNHADLGPWLTADIWRRPDKFVAVVGEMGQRCQPAEPVRSRSPLSHGSQKVTRLGYDRAFITSHGLIAFIGSA